MEAREQGELLSSLAAMFPDAPLEYLEEQVPDLAGKPAATERFINGLLEGGSLPPEDWRAGQKVPLIATEETTVNGSKTEPILIEETEPVAGPSHTRVETDEEKIEHHFTVLEQHFPDTDPEFLHERARDMGGDEMLLQEFMDEAFESEGKHFPTRKEYDKRREHALLVDKYSKQMSVSDILDIFPDPEDYFSKLDRKSSDLYKKLSLAHLKREFRYISSGAITQVCKEKKYLYYPAFKLLKSISNIDHRRKTRRPDAEVPLPPEADINFLKELQFCRIEKQIQKHKEDLANERQARVEAARVADELEECACCYSDDVLPDEMVPCSNGHKFCVSCVQRASEVAIGDGKTALSCLGQCEDSFELATLQQVLNANMFSKWLKKIQVRSPSISTILDNYLFDLSATSLCSVTFTACRG